MLVKPTHYCDDGYPIRWFRSTISSNSLACIYGIAKDCNERRVLGDDVEIDIHAIDEFNTRIRPDRIAALIKGADDGMVFLVGVQSNQTPRALDIARPLRQAGIKVGIGGFHMSGVIAMIDGDDPSLREAQAMGMSVFASEAEGRLDEVLQDAYAGRLKPLYNYMDDAPAINGSPLPLLERDRAQAHVRIHDQLRCRTRLSRINARSARSSMCRGTNHAVAPWTTSRMSFAATPTQGVLRFFITDDNFARNKDWEVILDRLIYLREVEKINLSLIIQVDTLCHKLPNFIAKCPRAGVKKTYIGLENINPANLHGCKEKTEQNHRIPQDAAGVAEGRHPGLCRLHHRISLRYRESILNDLDIIKRELPIDVLEIHYLTPLPGSEDHQKLFRAGTWMDPDLDKYDLHHITCEHARMSQEEWVYAYQESWKRYYSYEHCER